MSLIQRLLTGILVLAGFAVHADEGHSDQSYISIIIDDVGYNLHAAEPLITLPEALTISILPYSPHGKQLAKLAHHHNKEVMLHLPMESDDHTAHEPNTLMLNMEAEHFKDAFYESLQRVPYAVGVNNHMGSKLTSSPNMMDWLMIEIAKTPLYFVDSRTTTETVAESTAIHYDVPVLARDVFIDNNRQPTKIQAQLKRLTKLAKTKGFALAIGHPYPETYDVLKQFIQTLSQDNISLIPVSSLIQRRQTMNVSALLARKQP